MWGSGPGYGLERGRIGLLIVGVKAGVELLLCSVSLVWMDVKDIDKVVRNQIMGLGGKYPSPPQHVCPHEP